MSAVNVRNRMSDYLLILKYNLSIAIGVLNIECLLLPLDFSSSDEDEQQNAKLTPRRNITQK